MTNTLTTTIAPAVAAGQNKALGYLNSALSAITRLGVTEKKDEMPVQNLIAQVSEFGTDQAMTIALVLARQSVFNEVVREQIVGMDIANRFELITSGFTSIRDDAGKRLKYLENGQMSLIDKLSVKWGDMRKGTIPARFDKIKKVYVDVSKSLGDQLDRETRILDAYADYRFAQKDAETQAHILLANAEKALEVCRIELEQAQKRVDEAAQSGATGQALSALELERDEKIRAHQKMDERYQIAKDLADQLKVAYHASEFVFARLKQTSTVKKRLYDRGVSFFSASEIVFTGQAATFNSTQGLHEGTQTLNAMDEGIGKNMDVLASMGGRVLEDGLRAGYGANIKSSHMKKLVDAVCEFQESSVQLIQELRSEATQNADEVARLAEEGKQRFAKLLTRTSA